jgi:hypothetical protein
MPLAVSLSGQDCAYEKYYYWCKVNKEVQASRFTRKDGSTDIEGGKISMRYDNGINSDGIEMGVDDDTGYPFMYFYDAQGNVAGSVRMGAQGFKFYDN